MALIRIILAGLATGLAFALGLVCFGGAAATQGGRFSDRLDVASHFAPFWLAGGLVVLIFALLGKRGLLRVTLIILGLGAAVMAGQPVLTELLRPMSPRAPADAPHQIKLIQFNTYIDNRAIDDTARWIASQDADIVVIEEATPEIRDAILAHHPYHATCRHCSVIIFSRAKPLGRKVVWPKAHNPRPPATAATFPAADGLGPFTVAGVHLSWPTDHELQQGQTRRLTMMLEQFDQASLILAGDLNSTPWSFSRLREDARLGLERRTKALFSWPALPLTAWNIRFPFPFLAIDQVYAGSRWRTVEVRRGPGLGSDHYPVIVKLAYTPED